MLSTYLSDRAKEVAREVEQEDLEFHRSPLVEFWSKAQLRRHFRTAAWMSFTFFLYAFSGLSLEAVCTWDLFSSGPDLGNCFEQFPYDELSDNLSLPANATSILGEFCCYEQPALCFTPSIGLTSNTPSEIVEVDPNGNDGNGSVTLLAVVQTSGDEVFIVPEHNEQCVTNNDGWELGDADVYFFGELSNVSFASCCINGRGTLHRFTNPLCRVSSGFQIIDNVLALLTSVFLVIGGLGCLIAFRIFWAPYVQKCYAFIMFFIGTMTVVYLYWVLLGGDDFCVQFVQTFAGSGFSAPPCEGLFRDGSFDPGDRFIQRNYITHLTEAVFTATVCSLLIVAFTNVVSMAYGNGFVKGRMVCLNLWTLLSWVVRIVAFFVAGQKFGILPFVHVVSLLSICFTRLLIPRWDTQWVGIETSGLAELGARVVAPQQCGMENVAQLAGSGLIFFFEVTIFGYFAGIAQLASKYLRSQLYETVRSAHLRFIFMTWHVNSLALILLLAGFVIVFTTTLYATSLFQYNNAFNFANGDACR